MCGRYYIEEDYSTSQLMQIILKAREKAARAGETLKTGEIFPSNIAPVIAFDRRREKNVFAMKWGFSDPDRKALVINARCEMASQKPMFRDAMLNRRCVIPASGYYEWRDKAKYRISVQAKTIFMAGIYRFEGERAVFCILTAQPVKSVSAIHERMPLILSEEMTDGWIKGEINVWDARGAAGDEYGIAKC